MTKQVQRRRGTATQHTSFTGAEGEISVNTTNKSTHVHDGVTAGGIEAARADLDNVDAADVLAAAGITASATELNRVDGVTSPLQAQIDAKAPKSNATFTGSTTIPTADINGGTIDGTVIGGATPAAVTGTAITATGASVFASLDISGDLDVDGTTNLDVVDIDGAVNMATTAIVTGVLTTTAAAVFNGGFATAADVSFGDNDKAIFGAGSDLQIYHDGLTSIIKETGTGDLRLQGANIDFKSPSGQTYAYFNSTSGATGLYYAGSQKLATTNTGVDITGTVTATGSIVVAGTVDGRDVAADGTKLDGIEASADVTDTANVTAAGALMDSELTAIASVKALNQGVATTDSPTFANITTTGIDDNATSTAITIDASENVGIGVSTPNMQLQVSGGIAVSGDSALTQVSRLYESYGLQIDSGDAAGNTRPIVFRTGGTQRMTVDSSGRVTTPYQPAFRIGMNASTFSTGTGAQFLTYNFEFFDNGNNYNTSTGRYTIPVSGVYQFTHNVTFRSANSTVFEVKLFSNNIEFHRHFSFGQSAGGNGAVATTIRYCSAGDYIQAGGYWGTSGMTLSGNLDIHATSPSTGTLSSFSGHLIG